MICALIKIPNPICYVHSKKYNSLAYSDKQFFRKSINFFLYKCSYFNEADSYNEVRLTELYDLQDPTELIVYDDVLPQVSTRDLLYAHSNDPVILKLNECSSISEVLDFIKDQSNLKHEHIAQAVLIMWDLKKMFYYGQYHVNNNISPSSTSINQDFTEQIINHPKFLQLLECIKEQLTSFDAESLSCVLLYLNKIGLNIKQPIMEMIVMQLQGFLKADLSLTALSRFFVVLFSDYNLGSFFMVQDALPILTKEIEKCNTVEDLKLVTICMIKMQQMICDDILEMYRNKVIEFKIHNKLTVKDYRTLLKIITFLSYPQWNNENTVLVSEIMLILKNNLHLLNVYDFILFYEVFYKNQEPGELLTELQRCGSRLLLHLEEDGNLPLELKVKLLTSIICFSSPTQRSEYEKLVLQCIKEPLTKSSTFDMLKVLTFIKPNDVVSNVFWDNVLKCIRMQEMHKDIDFLLGLCHKYMNYNNDAHYRHKEFEVQMLSWLKSEVEDGISSVIPSNVSLLSAFIFAYSRDANLINTITQKVCDNCEQFNHIDCLYLSKGIRSVAEITKNPFVDKTRLNMVNEVISKSINERLILKQDAVRLNFLIKSSLYRKTYEKKLFHSLSEAFDSDSKLSSNSLRNLIYSLQASSSLLPNFMEQVAEYVINYKDHILGFNAEKVVYLCYILGYLPNRSDELFQAVTDTIIRDQERISGLSYLQAALALCFFNKLPESYIRSVFNVSFLEKLDMELAKCYSKDIYSVRVRNSMMQLNRAVCLDYPQANIPWFHQKHYDEMPKVGKTSARDNISSLKWYLLQSVGDEKYLLENFISPYGYHIDFLVHLNANKNLTTAANDDWVTRIAVMVLKPTAYTNITVQLKGPYQLKTRHLEILGYKVVYINLAQWNSLLYGEEKLEYINHLIWPDNNKRIDKKTLKY